MIRQSRTLLQTGCFSWAMLLLLSACPSSARTPDVIPTLPGDGDANTAKPSPIVQEQSPDDPWAKRDDLITAPAPMPVQNLELPPIERFTLANGLRVIVVQSRALPVAHLQLAVQAGRMDSPRDKMGLAEFTAGMLSKGTRARNAVQIAETIDRVGGSLSANAGFDITLVSCSVLSKDLGTCATVLSDITINPIFPAGEMDEIEKQLLATVRQLRDDAGKMANVHLQNLLWGEEHVRGWPMSGRTIDAIERADLVAWHRTWFVPDNAVLAVAGDVDPKAVRAQLEQAFRLWRRGKAPAHTSQGEPELGGIKIRLVDKPGQTQSHIRVGQLGIAHKDPAFFDHEVFNYVLGGGAFSSRLMRVVRAEAGKTYGASSYFERNRERGSFVLSTFTRNAEVLATLKLLLDELTRMQEQGPSAAEVGDAITHLTGAYTIHYQSPADLASALLAADIYELGNDFVKNYPLAVAKVTTDSASKAAARTLTPKRLAVVIVGDASQVAPQLEKAGWAFETISHLQPIAAYERNVRELPRPVDPKAEAAARTILDRALKAKGGQAKLASIKSMSVRAQGKLVAETRELKATFHRRYQAPDKLRMDIEIDVGGGKVGVVTVLSGDKGWNKQPGQGVVALPPDAIAELKRQIWRDHEFVLLRHKDKGTRVEPLGEKTVEGRTYDVVRVTRADGEVSTTLYVDKKTSMVGIMTYTDQGMEWTERYDDYKAVSGLQIAHRRYTKSDEAVIELQVSSVTLNDSIDASVFSEPK